MKVCVFGAGAIGGHLAGRLARGGAETSVVARGPHLAAMQAHGLRIVAPDGEFTCHPAASADPAELGPQDAVVVTVKAPALASIAAAIGPLLGPDTAVAFVMNGIPWWYYHAHGGPLDGTALPLLDPGGGLQRAIGYDRAVGGVVYSACTVVEPGVVQVDHARNRVILGEPDGQRSERVAALGQALERGGIGIEITDRIRDAVWAKLLLNLGSGPLGVLTGSAPRDFYAEPALREATRAILREGAALAQAVGCTVAPDADGQLRNGAKSGHKTSILQDLELGRPMEIDALYTVPLEMARAAGVPTPTLELLAALVRVRARAAGLYGGGEAGIGAGAD